MPGMGAKRSFRPYYTRIMPYAAYTHICRVYLVTVCAYWVLLAFNVLAHLKSYREVYWLWTVSTDCNFIVLPPTHYPRTDLPSPWTKYAECQDRKTNDKYQFWEFLDWLNWDSHFWSPKQEACAQSIDSATMWWQLSSVSTCAFASALASASLIDSVVF